MQTRWGAFDLSVVQEADLLRQRSASSQFNAVVSSASTIGSSNLFTYSIRALMDRNRFANSRRRAIASAV
jgi:hypothetical protein